MRRFDRRLTLLSFGVAALAVLSWPSSAQAARVFYFDILLDGKLILQCVARDEGFESPDQVWDSLSKLQFKQPDRQFIAEKERPAKGFAITPDKDDPLRATLKGKVRVFARYGGDVTVTSLNLVRDKKDSQQWRLASKEVERTKKLRKVDPSSKVRN
jgi:hypothetical protein